MKLSPIKAAGKAASSPCYVHNRCRRFKQSRFGPAQATAPDGKKWWGMFDFKKNEYVPWCKFRLRRQAIVQLAIDLRHNRLPYEPDPGFDLDWLKSRSTEEIADMIDHN